MDLNKETPGASSAGQTEKKKALFLKQKNLLDTFLEHGAISKAQYEKSLHDLIKKMGITKDGSIFSDRK